MEEVFPVLAGIALGLATFALRRWLKLVVTGVLSVGYGTVAAWISGELAVSWKYLVIDSAQVGAAAGLTGLLVAAWLRQRARAVTRRPGDAGAGLEGRALISPPPRSVSDKPPR